MTESVRFEDEFFSMSAVDDYYKTKVPDLDIEEMKVIIKLLKDLGKMNEDGKFGNLLDVGCGPGMKTSLLAKSFNNAIGIDTSLNQIKIASQVCTLDHVEFKTGAGEIIPIEDHSIDVITTIFSAQNFDVQAFATECRRVLKPQGVAIVYSDFLSKMRSADDNTPAIVDEIKVAIADCYASAKEMSHPCRHVLNGGKDLYESLIWPGKAMVHQNFEVVSSLAELRDYYLGIPAYGKLSGVPLVKLFEKVQQIWGLTDGEESKKQVDASFLAAMIVLNMSTC